MNRRTMMNKTVLGISEVANLIKGVKVHLNTKVILPSGQCIPVTKKLALLLSYKDLTCAECGCCGTHLQQHQQRHTNKDGTVSFNETWRVMSYNKKKNCQTFLNLDHIIPKSLGGRLQKSNIRITCESCNATRGDRIIPISSSSENIKIISYSTIVDLTNKIIIANTEKVKRRIVHILQYFKAKIKKLNLSLDAIDSNLAELLITKALKTVNMPRNTNLIHQIRVNAVTV